MRVAIIPTYPLYYDSANITVEEWLEQPNRERWMVSLMADMGHEAELWAVGEKNRVVECQGEEGGNYRVRFFAANRQAKRAKRHFSEALTAYAREYGADIHLLKGVDGGAGLHLLEHYLARGSKHVGGRSGYGFIIGGGFRSPYMKKADVVFYETEAQKQEIQNPAPGWQLWRKGLAGEKLIRLPKWIDTGIFRPLGMEKKWDILVVGRLVRRMKNYDAVLALAHEVKVAIVGDGPELERLRSLCPGAEWLGYVSNQRLPYYYNQSRLFMHTSFIDYYPRVIAESLACGVPCVAFAEVIAPDVLPGGCGLRVSYDDYIGPVCNLLNDPGRLKRMSEYAREHALEHTGKHACMKAVKQMFDRLEK